jgi:peptidoglycan/xylan/chitin deacetylase (PgdA/CDA1 family)
VIRFVVPDPPLSAAEQFGWDLIRDASRLIAVDGASAPSSVDIVAVRVGNGAGTSGGSERRTAVIALSRGFDVGDGEVVVARAMLQAVADVGGAAVEQGVTAADRFGRVPSIDNPMVAAGREREPLVSVAAQGLRDAVTKAAGRRTVLTVGPWPEGRRWAAAFSHDVDVVAAWPLFTALRLAELAKKGHFGVAVSSVLSAVTGALSDPVTRGVREVLDIEQEAGITSTWFILCGTPTLPSFVRGDLTYRPDSRKARAIIRSIRDGGHEIGLHGSFITMEEGGTFASQRTRLTGLSGRAPIGARQHFLRMRPGATQQAMRAAGFEYDATFGFADRNGFRLGVADVVPAWSVDGLARTGIDEVPLVWMDRAQSKYQGVEDPAWWVDDALQLAAASQRVEGLWVGLWHPNLTAPLGYPGAPLAYRRLVSSIAAQQPYIAPLERVVAWRRLRRAVTVASLSPDGATITAPSPRAFDVTIEDRDGRVVATITKGEPRPVPVAFI